MGVSTDGILCYGVEVEEESELPWKDGDIGDWWIKDVKGWKPSIEIYTPEGEYINEKRPDDKLVDQYYDERSAFKEKNPCPVEIVVHCSYDYPMYIIAIPRTVTSASRGYVEEIKPLEMIIKNGEREALMEFCKTYNVSITDEYPKWILASLWG
jgi:hypothetical protein